MAQQHELMDANVAARRNRGPNKLREINLKKAANGGVVAEHRMERYEEGGDKTHVFGNDEGHKLAAHLEKHLGVKLTIPKTETPKADAEDRAEDGGDEPAYE